MKLSLAFLLISLTAQAHPRAMPDLPPDAPSSMYPRTQSLVGADDGLDPITRIGERNLAWLNHINSLRPAGDKLSFTSKETQSGIPITSPSEYNPELVRKRLADLRPKLPAAVQAVLFDNQPFTDTPPGETKAYLDAGRELDRVFQLALRWRMMSSWLSYLADNRHNDLRGWYFLSRLDERAAKLRDFAHQSADLQAKFREWLAGMCFNDSYDDEMTGCQNEVSAQIDQKKDLEAYYQSMAPASAALYERYYRIPDGVARPEIRFDAGAQPRLIAPFQDPGHDDVRHFLQDNIHDEWRFGTWHLELPFASSAANPHVEFVAGATPHVNALGGSIITMNATQPLTEYDAQWTIRHEYGHVLGFPDCYVEFYVRERNVIVNYQFDIDNLMCSRRGHIQEKHVSELRRVYSRK